MVARNPMVSIGEFGNLFPAVNNKDKSGFRSWLFQPGMGYGDSDFWWSTLRQKRPADHEGIDFFCYEDNRGRIRSLSGCLVPAPCGGQVIAVCRDFLGQSVFLLADQVMGYKGIFVLAHITPHVHVGQRLKQGNVVGRVAETQGEAPSHLHVSFVQGDHRDLPAKLSWPTLLDQQKLRFLRPFSE